jgi:ER lumen protein retaining receptor
VPFWASYSPTNTSFLRYERTSRVNQEDKEDADTIQMLWAFSIWLEAVAILPQLFMLQRTGEAETITTHYLFALGAYRALYIPNWIYRWITEGHFEPISVVAGLVQTILYSDFFYIYYTK